jgi:hypothetical protein
MELLLGATSEHDGDNSSEDQCESNKRKRKKDAIK